MIRRRACGMPREVDTDDFESVQAFESVGNDWLEMNLLRPVFPDLAD
jgi:hypothetical protein